MGRTSCRYCQGSGFIRDAGEAVAGSPCGHCDPTTCATCDGDGKVLCDDCDGEDHTNDEADEGGNLNLCERCEGTGRIDCDDCGGTGEIEFDADEDEYDDGRDMYDPRFDD